MLRRSETRRRRFRCGGILQGKRAERDLEENYRSTVEELDAAASEGSSTSCELLCGACETDYGHSSVGECTRCQATWIYTALISFTMLLSLFLVIDTLRGNLSTERCQYVFEAQGFSMHIPLAEISCLNGEPQAEKSQASSRETTSHRLLVVDIVRLWGISL
ncbi:hypothetical protein BSKO_13121 [Bryopsis sp. KO-2023]|nr:hypothetical protein BSKO_13121 [Bryopsis sp. KO-2023]